MNAVSGPGSVGRQSNPATGMSERVGGHLAAWRWAFASVLIALITAEIAVQIGSPRWLAIGIAMMTGYGVYRLARRW